MPADLTSTLAAIGAVVYTTAGPAASVGLGDYGFDVVARAGAAIAELSVAAWVNATGPTWVVNYLALAVVIIQSLEYLNGFGTPDIGGEFQGDSAKFSGQINDILVGAAPGEGWKNSKAAREYGQLTELLRTEGIAGMAKADAGVAKALANQAEWVGHAREYLAGYRVLLLAAIVAAMKMCATYEALMSGLQTAEAEALDRSCRRWGYGVTLLALTGALAAIGGLMYVASLVADGLGKVTDGLQLLASTVHDLFPKSSVPAGATLAAGGSVLSSVVPGFADFTERPSDPADPPVPGAADGVSDWRQWAPVSALDTAGARVAGQSPPRTAPVRPPAMQTPPAPPPRAAKPATADDAEPGAASPPASGDPDRLEVAERPNSLGGQLSAVAGALDPAER